MSPKSNKLPTTIILAQMAEAKADDISALVLDKFALEMPEDVLNHADLLANININELAENAVIDVNITYCSKTGQPTGTRSPELIATLIQIHGLSDAQELVKYIDLTSGPAPHWIRTDSKSLDKLQKLDPLGYFMYALSFVLERNQPEFSTTKGWKNQEARLHFYMDKIVAWQSLKQLDLEKIKQANNVWREALSFLKPGHFRRLKNMVCSDYCTPAGLDNIINSVRQSVKNMILAEYHHKPRIDAMDFAQLKQKYPGLSAFRGQNNRTTTVLAEEMEVLFNSFGLDQFNMPLPKKKWDGMDTDKIMPQRGVKAVRLQGSNAPKLQLKSKTVDKSVLDKFRSK